MRLKRRRGTGQKVCLVDADLRRGQLRRHFDLPRNLPGPAEVRAGAASLEDALHHEVLPNLAFLPSGRYPPNPSELLMRQQFAALVKAPDSTFDLTVFDCPPAGCSPARRLSSSVRKWFHSVRIKGNWAPSAAAQGRGTAAWCMFRLPVEEVPECPYSSVESFERFRGWAVSGSRPGPRV